MYLCDFHIHSNFSDGKLSIPEIVDLYGQAGFNAIAITDHLCEEKPLIGKLAQYLGRSLTPATFPLYQAILKSEAARAWKMYRMLLIPGFEITKNSIYEHRTSHILALGVQTWISADGELEKIADRIHEEGGFSVVAHPVRARSKKIPPSSLWADREYWVSVFDAWEVTHGATFLDTVAETSVVQLANSDMHARKGFSAWRTLIDCNELHFGALFRAVRQKQVRFQFVKDLKAEGENKNGFLGYDFERESPLFDLGDVAFT